MFNVNLSLPISLPTDVVSSFVWQPLVPIPNNVLRNHAFIAYWFYRFNLCMASYTLFSKYIITYDLDKQKKKKTGFP